MLSLIKSSAKSLPINATIRLLTPTTIADLTRALESDIERITFGKQSSIKLESSDAPITLNRLSMTNIFTPSLESLTNLRSLPIIFS